jgi:endogenous inhibitor of DNA gyrase (YacG/DUF329 family)
MGNISRPQRMGAKCPHCGYSVSDRSENIYTRFPYDLCPKCHKSVHPMRNYYYYCDNCNRTHGLTTLGQFRCACGWISLIE